MREALLFLVILVGAVIGLAIWASLLSAPEPLSWEEQRDWEEQMREDRRENLRQDRQY